jgi:hypothetical protein
MAAPRIAVDDVLTLVRERPSQGVSVGSAWRGQGSQTAANPTSDKSYRSLRPLILVFRDAILWKAR